MGLMTTQEMIDETRSSLGNRNDITDERIVSWLNWSIYEVCGFHRKRAYTPKRFSSLEGSIIANISPITGTLDAGSGDSTFVLESANAETEDDFYNGWAIKITGYDETAAGTDTPENLVGQYRYIIDYDGGSSTGTVISDWDVVPDEYTEYSLLTRNISISEYVGDPDLSVWAIEHVEKADGFVLDHVEWQEIIGKDTTVDSIVGEPQKYARHGDSLVLDVFSEDRDILRIFYYAFPTALSTTSPDVTTDLPGIWDEIIVLGGIYRGFGKLMEPDREYNAQQRFEYELINKLNTRQLEEPSMKSRGIGLRFS